MEDYLILICCSAVAFALLSIICSCWWYAKRQHVSYTAALRVLWQEGIVDGIKSTARSFPSAAKAAWSYTKRVALAFWEYLKPLPGKHPFTPALYEALYRAVKEYMYAPFQPVITVRYTPYPSAVYVAFYTKSAITPEVTAEVVWHVQAAFQEYLTCYGLTFDYTAVPFVQDNRIEVWLYYAETPAEYPAYRTACHQAMLMKADPQFRPLLESDIQDTAGIVLGYDYDQWKQTGRVVPIKWDMDTAPHMAISGVTGGGKTIFVKSLLEQLLRDGVDVTVCDFKGFGDLRGFTKQYAEGMDCDAAIASFCADFENARRQGLKDGRRKAIVVDEFGCLAMSKSKKEFDAFMRQISNLIYLSRAYRYNVILIAQRFDSSDVLKSALRDQLGIKVYLGTSISPQAAMMLFPNSEIDKSLRLEPFCGYISTPKTDCEVFITPKVDVPALDRRLKALGKSNGT